MWSYGVYGGQEVTKVFLAAPFNAKPRIREAQRRLEAIGYSIVSRWHATDGPDTTRDPLAAIGDAGRDLVDIHSCDLFIQDTLSPSTGGASHVEWGVSLTRTNRRLLVGPVIHIYHYFAFRRFEDWDEAISWLST